MSQPPRGQGQSRGVEKTVLVSSEFPGAAAQRCSRIRTNRHTMQPSAPPGEGGVAADKAWEPATGRGRPAEPACALATALPHGSGGQGGCRDPSAPISGSWGGCGERSVLQWAVLQPLEVSCPGLTPRWPEGSPAQSTETHVPAGPCPAVSPRPPVSASPNFLPTGNPPAA